jgi:hypothetical protein
MPAAPPPPAAATAAFTGVLTAAVGQDDDVGLNGLGNRVKLALAQMRFEELEVAALHADNGKAGPAGALADVTAFAYKNLSHLFHSFLL